MKAEDFQNKINDITNKIGDEKSNLVLDEIGVLLNDNAEMNKLLDSKEKENENLKARIDVLQNVNGNLLQQVASSNTSFEDKKEEEKRKPYDYKSSFNKKGEFI